MELETCGICQRPLDTLDGKCGSDDAECLRIGYDRVAKVALKLSVELSEQKARADAAEADARFARLAEKERAKVQESFEAALAAARRECEGLRKALRNMVELADYHVNEIEGIAENDFTPENITRAQLVRTQFNEAAALAAPAAGEEGKR